MGLFSASDHVGHVRVDGGAGVLSLLFHGALQKTDQTALGQDRPLTFIVATSDRRCQADPALTRQGDKPTGLYRHLEGWQLGLVSITMAVLASALALPRAAAPHGLPSPTLDHRRLAHQHTLSAERARHRHAAPLPYEVRALGEAIRRFGLLDPADGVERGRALEDLRATARTALAEHGAEPLVDLQALQTELFLTALRHFEGSGRMNAELRELGGTFVDKARKSGWLTHEGRLLMTTQERYAAFRTRWSHLVDLGKVRALAPTLLERRVYYAFLMQHPEAKQGDVREDRARRALSYLGALVEVDPDYPEDYARGVLYYQAGMYQPSMAAFERHLSQHPSGQWTLRARNFWLGAARQLGQAP